MRSERSARSKMAMEETFEIEIPDEEAEKLKTVQDVTDYLAAKGKA